MTYNVLVGR